MLKSYQLARKIETGRANCGQPTISSKIIQQNSTQLKRCLEEFGSMPAPPTWVIELAEEAVSVPRDY